MVCAKLDKSILPTAFAAPVDASSDEERVTLTKRTLATVCEHDDANCRRIAPPTRERRIGSGEDVGVLDVLLHFPEFMAFVELIG